MLVIDLNHDARDFRLPPSKLSHDCTVVLLLFVATPQLQVDHGSSGNSRHHQRAVTSQTGGAVSTCVMVRREVPGFSGPVTHLCATVEIANEHKYHGDQH